MSAELGACSDGAKRVERTIDGERNVGCIDAAGERHGPWLAFHRSAAVGGAKLRLQARYEHGRAHGRWRVWYDNGARYFEGGFDGGAPDGDWSSFYDDGGRRVNGSYVAGEQHGTWVLFGNVAGVFGVYDQGQLVEGQAIDPVADRLSVAAFERARPSHDGSGRNVLPDGICPIACPAGSDWVHRVVAPGYANSGVTQSCMRIKGDREYVLASVYVEWSADKRVTRETIQVDEATQRTRRYHENGAPKWLATIRHKDRNGPWVAYHRDGSVKERGAYHDDKRDGPWLEYHPNGKLRFRGSYRRGKSIGEHVIKDERGALQLKMSFKDFRLHGAYFWRSKDGTLEGHYKRGEQHGRWRSTLGGKERVGVYDRGRLIEGDRVGPPEG